jgi:ATP-binding cassette subfamily C exporter for protease/lipase
MAVQVSALASARSVIRREAPGLIVFSCVVNLLLLLVSAIYMLQVYDRVLSSGSMDTLLWLTVAALVALAIYGLLEQARRGDPGAGSATGWRAS